MIFSPKHTFFLFWVKLRLWYTFFLLFPIYVSLYNIHIDSWYVTYKKINPAAGLFITSTLFRNFRDGLKKWINEIDVFFQSESSDQWQYFPASQMSEGFIFDVWEEETCHSSVVKPTPDDLCLRQMHTEAYQSTLSEVKIVGCLWETQRKHISPIYWSSVVDMLVSNPPEALCDLFVFHVVPMCVVHRHTALTKLQNQSVF